MLGMERNCKVGYYDTCLSQSHRTCWGPSADPPQSETVSGHRTGLPGPQSSESVQQHRPESWPRWAATAGTDAGSCRTTVEGSGGSWRIGTVNKLYVKYSLSVYCVAYWCKTRSHVTLVFVENVIHRFRCVCVVDYVKVHMFIDLCEVTLTVPKTSGALSCAQWSAGHCSGWRRGSLEADLAAVPCKRQKYRLKMTGTSTQIAFDMKTESICLQKSSKCTYISIEFACSFCLSHTNSLYLLLTLEIFLVKHTLLV